MTGLFHELAFPLFNFVVLVGLLYWKLSGPTVQFVRDRHAFIRDELKRVADQLSSARTKFDEFSAKLKAIGAEVEALRMQSAQEGEAMKVRIVTDAKRLGSSIVTESHASAKEVFADAKSELRVRLGLRILDRTEQLLRTRLTGDDQARIRREFSQKVESAQ